MKSSIDIVAERFLTENEGDYHDTDKAKELSESMSPDGSWADLDYEGVNVPFWKCISHFQRLNYLATAGKYDDKVIAGLSFWYQKERKDKNWWWNEIGIQIHLSYSAVLLRNKFDALLKKQVADTFNEYVEERWTGTNRFWLAQNVIVRGIVLNDCELIERGKKYLEDTIFISKTGEEGIQPDFAFAQHGPQLYNNGYGRALIMDACSWIFIFKDTEFQFSNEKIEIITSLLLDGSGQMCFCDVADHNTIGRDIVRSFNCRDTRAKDYLPAIKVLKEVSPRTKELQDLEDYINGNSRVFERCKMFSSLNIMTGVLNGGYASCRFGSDKVLGGDVIDGKIINDEDRFSGFRGCFTTEYMVNGREYDRIFPVWNWGFLPGVTCPDIELPTQRGAVMKSTFAGGVSDGKNGVCAIDLHEDFSENEEKVVFGGKKACFFINNEIIHLGCNLYSETTLNTTINQCNFDGYFCVDGKKHGMETVKKSAKYLYHGKIAYIFPEITNIVAFAEHRNGEWNKITFIPEIKNASNDIFTAYIPQNVKNNYEYAVLMNVDEMAAKNYKFPEFINTDKIQAVKRDDLICAVFYEPCSVALGDAEIKSERPGFKIIKNGKVLSEKYI